MKKDRIYSNPLGGVQPFAFNEQVAQVFDDMLERSVPLYREGLRRQAQLARRYYHKGTSVYDLGCSHGNLGMAILDQLGGDLQELVGVDTSGPMLDRYRLRLQGHPWGERVALRQEDIRATPLKGASVVVINLTLQFLPLEDRHALLARVYQALVPGGILLLTEKTCHETPALASLEQERYYNFKAENGYSDLEISQKRDALETVLLPESLDAHLQRLETIGFEDRLVWLKWFNFASLFCRKPAS